MRQQESSFRDTDISLNKMKRNKETETKFLKMFSKFTLQLLKIGIRSNNF